MYAAHVKAAKSQGSARLAPAPAAAVGSKEAAAVASPSRPPSILSSFSASSCTARAECLLSSLHLSRFLGSRSPEANTKVLQEWRHSQASLLACDCIGDGADYKTLMYTGKVFCMMLFAYGDVLVQSAVCKGQGLTQSEMCGGGSHPCKRHLDYNRQQLAASLFNTNRAAAAKSFWTASRWEAEPRAKVNLS